MDWYRVSFDEQRLYRNVAPPGRAAWGDALEWARIIRVCYQVGDFIDPDEIYLFSDERPESYLIPLSADGGKELFDEILRRQLLPGDLALQAMLTPETLVCWPEH